MGLTPHCILIRRDGDEFAIEDSAAPIHNQRGATTGAIIVFHDVSVARAIQVEMSHLAQHDTNHWVIDECALPGRMLSLVYSI